MSSIADGTVCRLACLLRAPDGERLARWIHDNSPRGSAPFVVLDARTVPRDPLAGSLAMVGEVDWFDGRAQQGYLGRAAGGTLFVDHVESLSPGLQVSLARMLERGRMRPVGATRRVPIDVQLLAATTVDLEREVACGRFSVELWTTLTQQPDPAQWLAARGTMQVPASSR